MSNKYNPLQEELICTWIETIVGLLPDREDLWKSLKDGRVLCELVHKIAPNSIEIESVQRGANLPSLVEKANVKVYLDSLWKIGVNSSEASFNLEDLNDGNNLHKVFHSFFFL